MGRGKNPPPQFGQTFPRILSTHVAQNVHSYVQMRASSESGGNALLQFSQVGLSSSMVDTLWLSETFHDEPRTFYPSPIKGEGVSVSKRHVSKRHSSSVIPDPPISAGMSFIFGKPSFIRNFVS
jgi:hypothetical protein